MSGLRPPYINSKTKHAKILNHLAQIASEVEPVAAARLAAAIVYGNDIVSIGYNERRSHTFQARFSKNEDAIYMHAENAAIYRATKEIRRKDFGKTTLYVCRVKCLQEDQQVLIHGMACPCNGCMKAVNSFGIKTVVYSCEHNKFGEQYMTLTL